MYSQYDKDFYKKINHGYMDYCDSNCDLYGHYDSEYDFQTAYSVLYLQNIIHDEKSILQLLWDNCGYSDNEINKLMEKAYEINNIINNNYCQALFSIQKNIFPYYSLSDFAKFPIEYFTIDADKEICALTLMKSKNIAGITKADKFFAIDSRSFVDHFHYDGDIFDFEGFDFGGYLDFKRYPVAVRDVIDISNALYSNLEEKCGDEKSTEKFILENTKSIMNVCSNILDKIDEIERMNDDSTERKEVRTFIDELISKEMSVMEKQLKEDTLKKLELERKRKREFFEKEYTEIINDKDLDSFSPMAKKIYAALKLECKYPYSGAAADRFNDYKDYDFALLAGDIYKEFEKKYNNAIYIYPAREKANKDLTDNKEEFLKAIDKCVSAINQGKEIENLNKILEPALEKTPVTLLSYIKNVSEKEKYSDRKIESDIMKKSSSFAELKDKTASQQKKIISAAIKKIRALTEHLGR